MEPFDIRNVELKDFFAVLDTCKGDVFLTTTDGDRLNLKSTLCRIIGFRKLVECGFIAKVSIECSDPEDERKLFRFNLFGDKGAAANESE